MVIVDVRLDPFGEVPLFQQLQDGIVLEIAAGRLRAGDPLGSVRQVARSFGISPATVAKAYDSLRNQGLIRSNRRSGFMVVRDAASGTPPEGFASLWRAKARGLLVEALAQGMVLDVVVAEFASIAEDLSSAAAVPPNSREGADE